MCCCVEQACARGIPQRWVLFGDMQLSSTGLCRGGSVGHEYEDTARVHTIVTRILACGRAQATKAWWPRD
jgi:hypothetical protein